VISADKTVPMTGPPRPHRFGRSARLAPVFLILALAACSAVPDWADPTRLFDKSYGADADRLEAKEIPGGTPELTSVPEEPRAFSPKEARDERAAGLTADHDDALEWKQRLRGGSDKALAATTTGQLAAIIYFDQDDTALNSKDHEILRAIAALHEERGGKLRVVGHSASAGGNERESRGVDLSMERARIVSAVLLDLGIDQSRLISEAKSDSQPVPAGATSSTGTDLRRVEIFLEN
jgi:outer membrane protein OmpA-like peptidoglycan-associated protein